MDDSEAPEDRAEKRARRAEEADLIRQVADGSSEALGVIYDRYSGMMLALGIRILRDEAEAEEVLQEAFLQAWEQAERYNPERAAVSTWLVMMLRSRAIDRLRSNKVTDRVHTELKDERPGETYTSPEGAEDVLHQERRDRLMEELARLPEEQRLVLQLAYFRGMTQRQIAAETDTPLGTVKTRTLLGMKKLRRALADEVEELL